MIGTQIFSFIFVMWILIIVGGGVLVIFTAPISITGYDELNPTISSLIKAIIGIGLLVVWIYIFSKIKNLIFQKQISS